MSILILSHSEFSVFHYPCLASLPSVQVVLMASFEKEQEEMARISKLLSVSPVCWGSVFLELAKMLSYF